MAKATTVYQRVEEKGAGGAGLGQMPLTLWVITAGVVLYLYVRRASLGLDKHPAEKPRPAMRATAPATVTLPTAKPHWTPQMGIVPEWNPLTGRTGQLADLLFGRN
jgi:hypothetical protein